MGLNVHLLYIKVFVYTLLGLYTGRIDLWFEPFFVKEIRRVIEWLREIKTANQHCYKFLLIHQSNFLTYCKLVTNNVENIESKLKLFKTPIIIPYIKRSAQKGRDQLLLCLRHKTDKITIHANMEPRLSPWKSRFLDCETHRGRKRPFLLGVIL